MIVEILKADLRSTVGIGVVAPSINTCIWEVCWKEVAQPVNIVYSPSLLAMSVQSMNSHDTANTPISVENPPGENIYSRVASVPSATSLSPYGKDSWLDFEEPAAGSNRAVCQGNQVRSAE